jgi:hypothetical protein
MLAEVGRRADFALTPATDVVRVQREAENLVWDYQHVAGDLRRSDGTGQVPPRTPLHGCARRFLVTAHGASNEQVALRASRFPQASGRESE